MCSQNAIIWVFFCSDLVYQGGDMEQNDHCCMGLKISAMHSGFVGLKNWRTDSSRKGVGGINKNGCPNFSNSHSLSYDKDQNYASGATSGAASAAGVSTAGVSATGASATGVSTTGASAAALAFFSFLAAFSAA